MWLVAYGSIAYQFSFASCFSVAAITVVVHFELIGMQDNFFLSNMDSMSFQYHDYMISLKLVHLRIYPERKISNT